MTRWFYLALLLVVVAFLGSLYVYHFRYDDLPDQVPIHWNIHGQPDGFVPKSDVFQAFLLLPTVMAGLLLLTLWLPWLSPKHFAVDRFRSVYGYLMMLVVALIGFLHVLALWGSLQPALPLDRLLVGGLFLFFLLLGQVLGQVKRNFWIGVRTPWTLASEQVWDRTHRLSAWLFVALGMAGIVALVLGVPVVWCLIGFLVVVLVPVLYSLVLYKQLERQGKWE